MTAHLYKVFGLLVALTIAACDATGVPEPRTPTFEPVRAGAYWKGACEMPHTWARLIARGWDSGPGRDDDLVIVPDPPHYAGTATDTSHSGPYRFLQEVPLIAYGPGFIKPRGSFDPGRTVTLADIAPTYAELLGFDFPSRDGRPLTELLEDVTTPPRLIVTVSIDGGGWNVLNHWARTWPNLRRLIDDGVSVENAITGSSPSVTPAIHTTISTGAFPRRHGVTAIRVRSGDGDIVSAFSRRPTYSGPEVEPGLNLRTTTIGDLWDRANANIPIVGMLASGNYPLGMLGHGRELAGGDKDLAAFYEDEWATDPDLFYLPGYVREVSPQGHVIAVDRADGSADNLWLGHDLELTSLGDTPAAALWQEEIVEAILERESFGRDEIADLFYVHLKSPDYVGHRWNMTSLEERDVIASVDTAIGRLRDWLDTNVAQSHVLLITADHGQTPLGIGGWPIDRNEMVHDINDRFDRIPNGQGLIESTATTTLFLDDAEMTGNNTTSAEIASFLSAYTLEANSPPGSGLPDDFADVGGERVLRAAFPGRSIPRILKCTRGNGR
jgi:hypothetical protein